jgi:hypothetical protein
MKRWRVFAVSLAPGESSCGCRICVIPSGVRVGVLVQPLADYIAGQRGMRDILVELVKQRHQFQQRP